MSNSSKKLVNVQASKIRSLCGPLRRTTFVVLLGVLGVAPGLSADDADDPPIDDADKELVKRWYAAYDDIHKSLEVTIDDVEDGTTALESTMVLTNYDPAAGLGGRQKGLRHGRTYLWTREGKPAVVGSVWSQPERQNPEIQNVCLEFHSLAQQPVEVEKRGAREWRCEQPGIHWQNHRGPEVPATSRAARLIQMRQIARSYQASSGKAKHRLLPQPLYRYPQQTATVADGSLFVFTHYIDPQVFLLLEARDEQWSVAFVRSNIEPQHVTYQDEVVWTVERTRGNWLGIITSNSEPYFVHFARERRQADNPDAVLSGDLP